MIVALTQIDARRGFVVERELDEQALDAMLEGYLGYHAACPASYKLRLAQAGKGVALTGRLACTLSAPCRRCLDEVQHSLELELDVMLLPSTDLGTEEERELNAEELDTTFFDNGEINLNEILRESIVLELEPYLQCREDCAGLCAGCGVNLNRESCTCPPKAVDPRWQCLVESKRS